MNAVTVILVILGGFAVFYFVMQSADRPTKVCKQCGHVGGGKMKTRGSLAIEIVLWLCFIIPGLIYSLWRHGSRYQGCAVCGSGDLIPVDSPYGKQIMAARQPAPPSDGVKPS